MQDKVSPNKEREADGRAGGGDVAGVVGGGPEGDGFGRAVAFEDEAELGGALEVLKEAHRR